MILAGLLTETDSPSANFAFYISLVIVFILAMIIWWMRKKGG